MGQYKVPQNVEAEDKILGPLTIKQFIYIIIALMWGFIAIRLLAPFNLIIGIALAFPVSATFLALGLIQREGVSFENYFLAFIRYTMYPRRHVWMKDENPDIIKNAPKKAVLPTQHKEYSQGQLKQLAFIVDTRGNYKDPSVQLEDNSNQMAQLSARVIDPAAVQAQAQAVAQGANPVPVIQPLATPSDDVLDDTSTQSADVGALLQNVEVNLRDRAVAKMQQALQTVPKAGKTTAPQPTLTSDRQNAQVAAATQSQGQASGGTITGAQINNAAEHLAQQSAHLTVQRLAAQANRAIPLAEGQVAQIRV